MAGNNNKRFRRGSLACFPGRMDQRFRVPARSNAKAEPVMNDASCGEKVAQLGSTAEDGVDTTEVLSHTSCPEAAPRAVHPGHRAAARSGHVLREPVEHGRMGCGRRWNSM